jgi:hypothetical protein
VAIGEDFEDTTDVGAGVATRELAVAERPCAAFAEEIVALGIDRTTLVEGSDVGDSVFDVASTFENERLITGRRQKVAREESGRPGTDHDRPVPHRLKTWQGPVKVVGLKGFDIASDQPGFVSRDVNLGGVDKVEVVVIASVETLSKDTDARDRVAINPEPPGQFLGKGNFRVVEFEPDVGNFQSHGV